MLRELHPDNKINNNLKAHLIWIGKRVKSSPQSTYRQHNPGNCYNNIFICFLVPSCRQACIVEIPGPSVV